MIISCTDTNQKYQKMFYVPQDLPWKLESTIQDVTEECVEYALQFSCKGMDECIMLSEDLYGVATGVTDEDILMLFDEIVSEATSEITWADKMKSNYLDLGKIIHRVISDWNRQQKVSD